MSEPAVQVPADQLRRVFELLLTHVGQSEDGHVSVSRDYFWSIPSPDRYDVYSEPTQLTVGQVSEAWENLCEMLDDPSKVLGYGFVWLAEVLRAIGDEAVG